MSNNCRPQIQACATRAARLEPNGVPDPGVDNLYVSDSLIKFSFTANQKKGDEFDVPNACGASCVSYRDCDRTKWYDVEMQICTPDPEFTELLAGGSVLTNGEAVGYGSPRLNATDCPNGVSLEFWAKRVTPGGGQDSAYPWAWWVWPRVYLTFDSASFENAPFLPTFKGFAIENENWYDGPLNDWPVDSDRAFQWIPSPSIPEPDCGYQTLLAS